MTYTGSVAMTQVSISLTGTYFYNIPSTQGIGYGSSCTGSSYSSSSLYGVIGMGLPSSSSQSPFPTGITQFSITAYGVNSASLTLGTNSYLGPSYTVSANSNWQSSFTSIAIGGGTPYYLSSYVTWELAFQGIGVPQGLYNLINSTLAGNGAVCSPTSTYQSYYHYCTLSVPLSTLPNVVITLSGSQSITIPPYAYMGNTSSGLNYLTFTSIVTGYSSGNITVSSGYGSNIIMGTDAFAYFLPVFDSSNYANPQVTIYLQSENGLGALATLVGEFLLYIILGIIVAIIACCVCCCCICKASTRYVPPVAETIIVTDPGIQMTPVNGQPGYNPYAQPQPYGQPYGQPQPYSQPMMGQPMGQPMMVQPGVGQPMLAQPYNNQF